METKQANRAIKLELIIKMAEGNHQLVKDALEGRYLTHPDKKVQIRYRLMKAMFKSDFALRETIKFYMDRETQ
jgi:hypothetical protein